MSVKSAKVVPTKNSSVELLKKVFDLKSLLRKYRFDLSLGRLSNCMQIRKTKREIARVYTKVSQEKTNE